MSGASEPNRNMRRSSLLLLVSILWSFPVAAQDGEDTEVRIAFFGDAGTGDSDQKRIRDQLVSSSQNPPLDYVFLLGDNVYPSGAASDIRPKFLDIYQELFPLGIQFHSALGNHDLQMCRGSDLRPVPPDSDAYSGRRCDVGAHLDETMFGYVDGKRYYSVSSGGSNPLMEVFVLDSNTLRTSQSKFKGEDTPQLAWLEGALGRSTAAWKIVTMHHPIHSPPGERSFFWFCRKGHDPELELREDIEAMLSSSGVDAVFQGHNHFFARMVPQKGVRYFVAGAAGGASTASTLRQAMSWTVRTEESSTISSM